MNARRWALRKRLRIPVRRDSLRPAAVRADAEAGNAWLGGCEAWRAPSSSRTRRGRKDGLLRGRGERGLSTPG